MQRTYKSRWLHTIIVTFLALAFVLSSCERRSDEVPGRAYHHLVILGDPHIPKGNIQRKERALRTINEWEDVAMVIAAGDICAYYGTDAEYAQAKEFFSKLHKPLYPIAGNHDYIYEDLPGPDGEFITAAPAIQRAKLQKFRETFNLANHFYRLEVGGYLLLFLSADHESYLSGMSEQEIGWLRAELARNPTSPTIIIFHGPLQGTLRTYRPFVNSPHFIAQPAETIDEILRNNPQVFLWVSGHTHTQPLEESYASKINRYAGQVTNIHNTDMNRETIWTNSLYLYPDRVVVRTFHHQEGRWLPEFDRTIIPPKL